MLYRLLFRSQIAEGVWKASGSLRFSEYSYFSAFILFSSQICERQQRDISYMQLQLQSSHDMLSKHVTETE